MSDTASKIEAAQCDELAVRMGYTVIKLEQRKASKIHIGTPDRRYVGRAAVFFEMKFGRDKLSREQHRFLRNELDAGALASCGGLAELQEILAALARPTHVSARNVCRKHLDRYAALGFRGERRVPGVAA